MNLFIWERIERATSNWHPEGGIIVCAETLGQAVFLASKKGAMISENELPDIVLKNIDSNEFCIVFPDAGCC